MTISRGPYQVPTHLLTNNTCTASASPTLPANRVLPRPRKIPWRRPIHTAG